MARIMERRFNIICKKCAKTMGKVVFDEDIPVIKPHYDTDGNIYINSFNKHSAFGAVYCNDCDQSEEETECSDGDQQN